MKFGNGTAISSRTMNIITVITALLTTKCYRELGVPTFGRWRCAGRR